MQDTVARAQLNLLNSKVKTLSNTQIPARLEHQGLKSSQSTLIASHMGMSPHHMTSWLCLILILCWKSTLAPPKMHLSKRSKELLWKSAARRCTPPGKVKAAVMRSICMDHWSPRAIKNCWHPHALQCQFGTSYVCSHCITRWLVQLPTWQQLLGIVATPTCAKGSAHHREFCTSSSTARISSANLEWVPSWNLRTWYSLGNAFRGTQGKTGSKIWLVAPPGKLGKTGSTQVQAFEGRALGPKQFCYKMQPKLSSWFFAKFLTHSKKHFDIAGLQ